MLKEFLLTAGIAAGVFGLCIGMFAILGRWDIENVVLVGVLYYTAFYLAPAAFLVGVIGSVVCAVRSMIVKRI
jgi:hypothetical protein